MATPLSDSIEERYALYAAGLAELEPQIRGLQDKVNDALSEELRVVLRERLAFLESLHGSVAEAKARQEQADYMAQLLEDGGFPTIPGSDIPAHLLEELNREGADDDAARAGFGAAPSASSITVSLGNPTSKP